MQLRWHHVVFDEESQTGFAEYTFELDNQYHCIMVIRVRDGLITHWREYQYTSDPPPPPPPSPSAIADTISTSRRCRS